MLKLGYSSVDTCTVTEYENVKMTCGEGGCKNLVFLRGRYDPPTCDQYCKGQGGDYKCVRAWEDYSDDCRTQYEADCTTKFDWTSDAICECEGPHGSNPTSVPSVIPSMNPSNVPSKIPSLKPSISPSTPAPTLDSFSWDLVLDTPGYLKQPPIQDGVHDFISKYNLSDRFYDIELFKEDCSTPSTGLSLTSTNDSKYKGTNHLEAIFLYNQSVIQTSNLWTANSTGGDVDFCVKLSLYSNSSNGILFNFIETIYKIQVDLVTGFSTTVDVVRTKAGDGGKDIIDADENITVFQCDDSYNNITSPPALTQGDALQICVETEDESVFEVDSFKDVTVSQNGTKSFKYVTNFDDSYWASSSCEGNGTAASVCKLKMQLLGEYFSDSNPADLTVEGQVKLIYLGRRRVLQLSVEDKKSQVDAGVVFTISVPVSGASSSNTNEKDTADVESTVKLDDMNHASIIISSLVAFLTTGIALVLGKRFI